MSVWIVGLLCKVQFVFISIENIIGYEMRTETGKASIKDINSHLGLS